MRALFKDLDVDVIEKVMGINFSGTLYCTKLALNSIIERKGTIVGAFPRSPVSVDCPAEVVTAPANSR